MKPNDSPMDDLEPPPSLEPELRELLDAARRRDATDPADEAGCEELLARLEATALGTPPSRKDDVKDAPRSTLSWILHPVGTVASLCLLATFAVGTGTREGAHDEPRTSQSSPLEPRSPDRSAAPPHQEAPEDRPIPTHVDALASSASSASSARAPVQVARVHLAPPRAPERQMPMPAAKSSSPRSSDPSHGGLAEEIRLIESARARMTAKDPTTALRLVREHERRFPDGQLAQQREWLHIQALDEMGSVKEARERTEQFRKRFPGGLLLPSVERTLDAAP